jgi:hypothetical protein
LLSKSFGFDDEEGGIRYHELGEADGFEEDVWVSVLVN